MSERRSRPVFRRSRNGALDEPLESPVFLSVFICVHLWLKFFFTEWLRLRAAPTPRRRFPAIYRLLPRSSCAMFAIRLMLEERLNFCCNQVPGLSGGTWHHRRGAPGCLTHRPSQPPLTLAVPPTWFTLRVGARPAFYLDGKIMRLFLFITLSVIGCFTGMPQTNLPPMKNPAEMMRELRLKMLTAAPSDFGQQPSPEFPRVCGVVMDWPIEVGTVTLVSFSTGDASIYSTGTFGVLGGIGHESVRTAAKSCVKAAQSYYDDATPTKVYPYPANGRVRFYLVGFDGVRVIDADLEAVKRDGAKYSELFLSTQRVISELRMITQQQKRPTP